MTNKRQDEGGKVGSNHVQDDQNSSINETGVEGGEVEEAIEGKEPNDDEIGREDEKEEGGVLKDEVAKPEQVA